MATIDEVNSQLEIYYSMKEDARKYESELFKKYRKENPGKIGEKDHYLCDEWSEVCKKIRERKEIADVFYRRGWQPVIGEGATLHFYTDAHAYTIISVSKSGQSFKMQRDKAVRLNDPEFIPGGFAGHCTNNNSIRYNYEKDEKGYALTVRRCKRNWSTNKQRVSMGRSEHYDYNF
jgi:hypothetical protein